MRPRELIAILGGATSAWPLRARARHAGKIPQIGWVFFGPPAGGIDDIFSYYHSFPAGLCDLGYVEGRNNILIARSALSVPEVRLINGLLQVDVSVIVLRGPAIRVVRERVKTISFALIFRFTM